MPRTIARLDREAKTMTDVDPRQRLIEALAEAPAEARAWLREGMDLLADEGRQDRQDREEELAVRFTGALRRLGQEPLTAGSRHLPSACGDLALAAWSRADAGRACLVLTAVGDGPGAQALVERLFRQGDEGERVAIVRLLCLLPQPCSLVEVARAAGRVNSLRLFGALALDNPYPAACYDDHTFNQLVLKCLFNGLPVGRIPGLIERANPELARMCEDYRDERVAAGRSVPEDLWLPLEPHASPRGLGLILAALAGEDAGHRYHAILALSRRRSDPAVAQALAERLAAETDPTLRRLLASTAA